MRYRPLGQSGLLVSVVGLGCNNFGGRLDADRTRSVVDAAIDVGITLFDTSDTYGGGGGSERALGVARLQRDDQVLGHGLPDQVGQLRLRHFDQASQRCQLEQIAVARRSRKDRLRGR